MKKYLYDIKSKGLSSNLLNVHIDPAEFTFPDKDLTVHVGDIFDCEDHLEVFYTLSSPDFGFSTPVDDVACLYIVGKRTIHLLHLCKAVMFEYRIEPLIATEVKQTANQKYNTIVEDEQKLRADQLAKEQITKLMKSYQEKYGTGINPTTLKSENIIDRRDNLTVSVYGKIKTEIYNTLCKSGLGLLRNMPMWKIEYYLNRLKNHNESIDNPGEVAYYDEYVKYVESVIMKKIYERKTDLTYGTPTFNFDCYETWLYNYRTCYYPITHNPKYVEYLVNLKNHIAILSKKPV